MKRLSLLLLLCTVLSAVPLTAADGFRFAQGAAVTCYVGRQEAEVVHTAVGLLAADHRAVFGAELRPVALKQAQVVVGTVAQKEMQALARRHGIDVGALAGRHEAFLLRVVHEPHVGARLLVLGSEGRGAAYGVVELTRLMGVSAWEWWADVTPLPMPELVLPAGYGHDDAPAVPYRGIFINDEDWGLTPWASQNYEPSQRAARGGDATPVKGEIGPHTHARIFELLLRLRANTFWPAMHECSLPFYHNPENQRMADRYGIVVSTSHCEPMMRNANGEWRQWAADPKGERYNYVTHRDSVVRFWEERVAQLRSSDCIYTLGMRGIHDGRMQGARTIAEQVAALTDILADQRALLAKYIDRDVCRVPQQFVPYKEVLDCYRAGLAVPDDVTLLWCDDNYGYLTHLPTEAERRRAGGNGVYYHLSYWGRPHDYTWLGTQHPELIRSEMLRGYDHGIDRIWIANVGDIKPLEFEVQFFLDMAWCPEAFRADDAVDAYVRRWYAVQLGADLAGIERLWRKFYDLSWSFKPEWMGGTRTEEADRAYWGRPHDLPLTEPQVRRRLAEAGELAYLCTLHAADVPATRRDAFFELVEYPVMSVVAQNEKWLSAQLARHGAGPWWRAHAAYDRVVRLTDDYNTMLGGKWRGMVSCRQRGLADYLAVPEDTAAVPMPEPAAARDNRAARPQLGQLVYASPSVVGMPVAPGSSLTFDVPSSADTLRLDILTLPVHPADGRQTRYAVSLDGGEPVTVEFHTEGRSEEWKHNVLYNRALRSVALPAGADTSVHRLTLTALDEGVRLQRVYLQ